MRQDISINYADYQEILDELAYRLDYSEKIIEPVFNMLLRVGKEQFDMLSESLRNKLLSNIRTASRSLKAVINKMNHDQKSSYVRKMIADLLETVDLRSLLLFNAIFEEGELFRVFSNNPFQTIMNYLIEELNLLTKIFELL